MYVLREAALSACGISASDDVLIAFSGGADSVALLLEMKRLRDEHKVHAIAAAHLNHGIRGEEAERDAAFCRELCQSLSIPFYLETMDVPHMASVIRSSLEAAAREARYAFLNRTCDAIGFSCIATAHHQNDQVETVLIHLIRGCGTDGLCGMQPRNGRIIRPFLNVSKQEILAFLREQQQPYCIDSTNDDPAYLRNRVRLRLLPLLEEWNANVSDAISKTALSVSADVRYLNEQAETAFRTITDRTALADLPDPIRMRVLKRYLPYASFERSDLETLDALLRAQTGTCRDLKQGWCAWVGTNRLYVQRLSNERFEFPLPIGGSVRLPNGTIDAECVEASAFRNDPDAMYLDRTNIEGTLTVRSLQIGDRFTPLGMTGTKLVSDYFTDRKVPRFLRSAPIVWDEAGIVCIMGFTVDERVKVCEQSQQLIQIRYKEDETHVG